MPGSSWAPERTDDPGLAYDLLKSTGAVILGGQETDRFAVIAACQAVLGKHLRVRWDPRTFRAHDRPGRKRQIVKATRTILEATAPEGSELPVEASQLVMEGYGLGDGLPDIVAYLCAAETEIGGDFYIVDGQGLLASLSDADLADAIWSSPASIKTHVKYPPQQVCLARRTRSGRAFILYVPNSLVGNEWWARRWHELVRQAAATAQRFVLRQGEVLFLDNYRVYCGREPYRGNRILHRGWFWSDDVMAYPMVTE
ncbi:MAG: TauD/TfdA family dioxygenase [Pseudaminobacter sp.]